MSTEPKANLEADRGRDAGTSPPTLKLIFTLDLDPTALRDGSTPAWIEATWLLAVAPAPPFRYRAPSPASSLAYHRPRRYPRGKGVRGSKRAFRCPPGCMAAYEAERLHHLPWQYASLSLDLTAWQHWTCSLSSMAYPLTRSNRFWLYTISDHEGASKPEDVRSS